MGDVEHEVHSARMLGCEISTNPLDPLEPILKMCEYHHPDEDMSILERAYERAVKQHSSQRRKSGEPYIIHPLAVAQILADLGLHKIRLITNNPKKIVGLKGYGLEVVERVPLVFPATEHNERYMATKKAKLGHLL